MKSRRSAERKKSGNALTFSTVLHWLPPHTKEILVASGVHQLKNLLRYVPIDSISGEGGQCSFREGNGEVAHVVDQSTRLLLVVCCDEEQRPVFVDPQRCRDIQRTLPLHVAHQFVEEAEASRTADLVRA